MLDIMLYNRRSKMKKKILIVLGALLAIAIVVLIIISVHNSEAGKLKSEIKELCNSYDIKFIESRIDDYKYYLTVKGLDDKETEYIINFLLDADNLIERTDLPVASTRCKDGENSYYLYTEESEYLSPSCLFIQLYKNDEEVANAVLSDDELKMNEYNKMYKKEMKAKDSTDDSIYEYDSSTVDNYADDTSDLKDQLTIDTDGKQIWKVYLVDGTFSFEAKYRGTGNFIVTLLDDNQDFVSLICNEIGDYNVDKTVYSTEGWHYLEIEYSHGSWNASWSGTYGQ